MRWTAKDYSQWHSYRPWLPVKVGNEWVWFERILRRGWPTNTNRRAGGGVKYAWEYINSEFDLLDGTTRNIVPAAGNLQSKVIGGLFPESGEYVSTASHQAALGQLKQKHLSLMHI